MRVAVAPQQSAPAAERSTPARISVGTKVIGADEPARKRFARVLAEAGFNVDGGAPSRQTDLILLLLSDATDAERGGIVRRLAEEHPDALILMVASADASNASLRRALLAGASGIVLDDDLERTLVPTARAMLAGQLTVPTALGRQIAPRPLSHREKQILALVMAGRTNREIADKLYLAESTVKTHLSSAFRKLDARSRSEAVTRIMDPESGYGATILELANGGAIATG
jgi:DNA-binding NarL/FixJ family response regulator